MEKLKIEGKFREDFKAWLEGNLNYRHTLEEVLTWSYTSQNEIIIWFLNNLPMSSSFTGNYSNTKIINDLIEKYNQN